MKPAWKEQTGGLREEGKSKMAQFLHNEVRNITFITSCRPNGSKRRMAQKEASVYWSFFLIKKTTEILSNIVVDFVSQGIVTLEAVQLQ